MKRIAFVIGLLTFFCSLAQAQSEFFLFIQAGNQQPFYVRLNEKTYSSSGIGHLVIPRLKDSTYSLYIGFPRNQYPEQLFVVTFNNKDLDYGLRYSESDGWSLVNGQTSETVRPRQDDAVKSNTLLGERRTGAFAVLMAGLVNDSAVMYKTIARTAGPAAPALAVVPPAQLQATTAITPVTTASVSEAVKPDTQAASSTTAARADRGQAATGLSSQKDPVAGDSSAGAMAAAVPPLSTILQVQEWWNDKGKGYIYYDSTATGIDTISILVEFEKNAGLATPEQVIAAPARKQPENATITQPDLAQQATPANADSATRKQADSAMAAVNTENPASGSTAPNTASDSLNKGGEKTSVANDASKAAGVDSAKISTAAADKPAAEKNAVEKPTVDKPTADKPAVDSAKSIIPATGTRPAGDVVKEAAALTDSAKAVATPASGATQKIDSAARSGTETAQAAMETAAGAAETVKKDPAGTRAEPVKATTTEVAAGTTKKDSVNTNAADARKTLLLMNSDCVNFATESDVDKLRVKMLNAANVEERIAAAKKVFKTKCFVTRYIRGLSELFPNDETKFQFFDAAYPYVSDSGNFRTLLDLFTDELYIARFKALVRM